MTCQKLTRQIKTPLKSQTYSGVATKETKKEVKKTFVRIYKDS